MKASEFTTEAVRQRLDPKCWKGKHKEGTKIKGGVRVNNCVPNESVTEGHSDQQRKVFKKNGHPVGEVGIDRESSPGVGQYYMKHYASGKDLAGYDSFEEAVAELKHCIKQGVSEGPDDDTSRLEVMRSEYAKAHKILNKFGNANMGRIEVMRLLLDNGISQKTANIFASKRPIKEQGVAEGTNGWVVYNIRGRIIKNFADEAEARQYAKQYGFYVKPQGGAENKELAEEFDLIENIIEDLADRNGVDSEVIWEDLESLTDDELYVFATTTTIMETEAWQKANNKDKTDGMSKKAVKTYRREHPGSKLQTAVTTKPSKLKKGSKASKRRKSYCSRSKGQMKMHNISCAKTPDKAICKARRRWNC